MMKILKVGLVVMAVFGCTALSPQGKLPSHEADEPRLLSEQTFFARVSQSVTMIYEGLLAISEAANQYARENNDQLPSGSSDTIKLLLLDGGYLDAWPVVPPFAFTEPVQSEFFYMQGYDDVDGIGAHDDVIFVKDLKIEVCQEFVRRYASLGPDDIIHDYEAARKKYPGEIIGRHVKIYAISWLKMKWPDYCDVNWVMQYND